MPELSVLPYDADKILDHAERLLGALLMTWKTSETSRMLAAKQWDVCGDICERLYGTRGLYEEKLILPITKDDAQRQSYGIVDRT